MGNKLSTPFCNTFDIFLFHRQDYLLTAFLRDTAQTAPTEIISLIKSYLKEGKGHNTGSWTLDNTSACKAFIQKKSKYHKLMQFVVSDRDITLFICGKYGSSTAVDFGIVYANLSIYCQTYPTLKKLSVKCMVFYYELTTTQIVTHTTNDYVEKHKFKRGIVYIDNTHKNGVLMYKHPFWHRGLTFRETHKEELFIEILNIHYDSKLKQRDFIRFRHLESAYKYMYRYVNDPDCAPFYSETFGDNLFYLQFKKQNKCICVTLYCNYIGKLKVKIQATITTDTTKLSIPLIATLDFKQNNVYAEIHQFDHSKSIPKSFAIALSVSILEYNPHSIS